MSLVRIAVTSLLLPLVLGDPLTGPVVLAQNSAPTNVPRIHSSGSLSTLGHHRDASAVKSRKGRGDVRQVGNNEPPPAGAILDLNGTPIPGGGDGTTFQQYSVNFTATLPSTAITFAFRDDPAYISFVDASVTDLTNPNGNILVNGDFSGGVHSENGDDYVPNGWTYNNPYGAEAFGEVQSSCVDFPYCWYDGSIQAYDEISQTIVTNVGDTYQITFSLAENSGCSTDGGPPCNFSDVSTNGDGTDSGGNGIDVTVYAQAGTPSTLANFEGSSDGADPFLMSLIQGSDGNFYGTTIAGGAFDNGTVFQVTPGGTLTTLYTFCSQTNCTDGGEPFSGLVQGSDGNFYGTTYWGGINGQGTIFKITPAGQLTTLHSFAGGPTEGAYPIAGLIQVGGNFYGTTQHGGANGRGTVFEVTPAGALTTLYSFCSQSGCTDGADPWAGLVQTGGNFYGTTEGGGANGYGTVFEITPAGQLTTLYSFCSQTSCADGGYPYAGLIQATDGNFYGTTSWGGTTDFCYGCGTAFQITPAGQLTTFYSFCSQAGCTDGLAPFAGLIQASDGNLYGTTQDGGTNGYGTVFGTTTAGQLTTLYSFGLTDGAYPDGGLLEASNGNLYGTAEFGSIRYDGTIFTLPVGLQPSAKTHPNSKAGAKVIIRRPDVTGAGADKLSGKMRAFPEVSRTRVRPWGSIDSIPDTMGVTRPVVTARALPAQSLSTLLNFDGGNGADPEYMSLIQGTDGNNYGTTDSGGAYEQGTVFKVTPGGTLTTLYTFCSQTNCTDGAEPEAGLVQGTDSNFYGTTYWGGANGQGTVFEVAPGGALTTLYSFCSQSGCADGSYPQAGLVQGADGNFYGTTFAGGAYGFGTVFVVTTAGQLSTLYNFGYYPDGGYPEAGLVQGADGNFYGTTYEGGANGSGTVFEMTPAGQLSTLYSFCSQPSCIDGALPQAGLVQASNQNFYGTTSYGGANGPQQLGTVFEITTAGHLTTLYSFCSQPNCVDGRYPLAGLVQAAGNFYGTTYAGGANHFGTVFEVTPAGQLTTLYSFGLTDGAYPDSGLLQANGNLYGTTVFGGTSLDGTIFSLPLPQALTLACPTGTGQVGVAYSSALVASGGVAPYTFSIISGSLPPGLSLNSSTGAITGTPTTAGTYNFTAQVVDSQGNTATASCAIVVSSRLTLSCPTGTGQVGVAYSSALTATGGVAPYTFSIISGSLPPGLSLNTSTGAITGTPTTAGTYNFTAQVVDSQGNTATANCSIVVASPGLTLACPTGTGQVGVAYSSALVASGGVAPYTFSITIGALPPGLSLNTSTGAITGTPTMAGTFNFTAQVVDSQGNTATANCSIVVSSPALTLSCPTGTAQVGVAYSSVLNAAGGVAPYTFSIISGSLPPGLSLNTSTGAITGTPTTEGTYNFTAQVVDSKGNTATANCSIVVTAAGTTPTTTSLTLAPSSIPVGSVGPIVMTATVTPVSGGGTPTGSVTFFNGSTQIGTATLSGGIGTFNYNPSGLAVGIYSITAVYSGDSMFSASTSPPQTLAITQTGPFAYVANNSSNTVSVINIPTGQVANSILVGSGPWGTAISPDQTQVYVTNNLGNSVSVISAASGTVVATIPVQSSPFGVSFSPDGSWVYVVNGSSNSVSVINPATQTVVATVPVQNSPVGVAMAPTSNGTFAYVTNSASNTVSVIAVTNNPTVVQTISVGTGPRWVTVSPNSAWAYVENAGSNNVSVISVATNQVTATISVGTSPFGAAVTPDNSTVYVANSGSNNVSVIDTMSNTVIDIVAGFDNPVQVALTMDGASAYVTNLNANTVSVIATASNTITGTVQVGNAPTGVAIASAPQVTLQITQPLSPTQQNTFNFGANNYAVQYPTGTQFSNVNMTVTAVEITQAQFQQRVAGTKFANASCIVYGGGAGNCIDDQVTCTDNNGNPISCPSEPTPTIAVQTSFTTLQSIINPGYLTTPIGQNMWKNIFSGFSDPTVKGKTQGFSEFIAVDLGATNPQGAAYFELVRPKFPKTYEHGELIPIAFRLTSVANGKPVTDAEAGLSVVMVADAKGNPTQTVVFAKKRAFKEIGRGEYVHDLAAHKYAAGTYAVTIYGDAFPSYQGQFKILH